MKLSFIFELLLIFILIAFAASASIASKNSHNSKRAVNRKHGNKRQETSSNKYCSCSSKICNCCREFNIPVVSLQGPGCASLQYLKDDRLAISMSFGQRVLTNTTISSKKPRPVCMPLPGGVSKFCGRVYNIGRKGDDFKACLGLELHALNDVEAALRVSCFRFGSNGLRVEPSQPLPVVENNENEDEDDDDDDDDEDEDDYDFDDDEDDDENEIDSVDYGTFSVFDDDFIGEYFASESSSGTKKKKKPVVQTTKAPVRRITRKPAKVNRKPVKQAVKKPAKSTTPVPAKLTVTQTTTMHPEKLNNLTEESIAALSAMLQNPPEIPIDATMLNSTEISTTTEVVTVVSTAETTTKATIKNNKKESEEDDEDPIAEVVGEVLEDEVESGESTTKALPNDKDLTTLAPTEESKDVLDDIVDGVVGTLGGESEEESSTKKTEDDDDDDDEEDDEEEDDDDDDEDEDDDDEEESRHAKKRRFQGRKSRDMWLDRLHW